MKGYRTLIFNGLRAVVDSGILAFLLVVDWETAGFTPQVALWVVIGLSITDKAINMWLRSITTTPVGKKQ